MVEEEHNVYTARLTFAWRLGPCFRMLAPHSACPWHPPSRYNANKRISRFGYATLRLPHA